MPETETARRERRAEARECGDFIGFLACSHGPGRVLKVKLPDERRVVRVRCPVDGCQDGEHKTGDAMPRPRHRGEVCDAELIIPTPPPDGDTTTQGGDPGSARRKVSDAAIFAAIPTDRDVLASEVAVELGYAPRDRSRASGLRERLRRMNKRAEDRGESPPFILSIGKRGQPMKVRRSGEGTIN